MSRILRISIVLAGLPLVPTAFAEDSPPWETLFDGSSLESWDLSDEDEEIWTLEGALLVADNREGKKMSSIQTREQAEDFDIEIELRIPSGRIALRKWTCFTLHLDPATIGKDDWFTVGLVVRGRDVGLYIDGSRADVADPGFKPGKNRFWLMAGPGTRLEVRRARWRRVAQQTPDPFEGGTARSGSPPDLSRARSLFSGASLLGWEKIGDWRVEKGAILGRAPDERAALLVTGKPDWGDGALAFEVQGISGSESLAVWVQYDGAASRTEIPIPASAAEDVWVPVVVVFRGDRATVFVGEARQEFEKSTRYGRTAFVLGPRTECAIRNVRLALDE